ncbi:hypothetical protein EAG_10369 [Camponotus floridanus]|uniref:Uncharacterized protein n=1 Tax=Camponotus floridanus TaxID=104421 RepID=E2ADN4_CAMFO|nr:hypothetical protein EAG_10369 [Camponotus floridanus]
MISRVASVACFDFTSSCVRRQVDRCIQGLIAALGRRLSSLSRPQISSSGHQQRSAAHGVKGRFPFHEEQSKWWFRTTRVMWCCRQTSARIVVIV